MTDQKKIALLIDCDNVSNNAIEGVLEELAKYGMVNVRHAHGDWKNPFLSGWEGKLHPHAIKPMQQFAYTIGKNSTDSAMIIDAMDLLHNKNIDAFALMTSDSDFTPLVLRILEDGLPVYGFGEKKTPEAFVKACSPFIYIENLVPEQKEKPSETKKTKNEGKDKLRQNKNLIRLLRTAVEQTSEDDNWANLSKVAHYIASSYSSFSVINYGYKKLSSLIRETQLFDEKMINNVMYIKDKRDKSK